MPRTAPIALVVPDEGLRGVLTARLSMAGEAVLTARDWRDPVVHRLGQRGATLIVHASLIADGDRGAGDISAAGWSHQRLIVLSDTAADVLDPGRLAIVPPDPVRILAALRVMRGEVPAAAEVDAAPEDAYDRMV